MDLYDAEELTRTTCDISLLSLSGRKDDTGKEPWHFMPWDALTGVVKVIDFGAKKYEPNNWAKGMAWSRMYSAAMRHLIAWSLGEKRDAETGYSHLWHAATCVLFLAAYEARRVGTDDRA